MVVERKIRWMCMSFGVMCAREKHSNEIEIEIIHILSA